jgi:cytosine/adenosine deaminase-related metal-dependent hydrolase
MLAQGVPVGLGVDGSASNDGSNMLAEVRQAMLLARLDAAPNQRGGPVMSARTALELATVGGAALLGRTDVGSLSVGMQADFGAVDLSRIEFAGALHDPVAALALTTVRNVDHSWVAGKRVVENGRLVTIDIEPVIEEHNRLAAALHA